MNVSTIIAVILLWIGLLTSIFAAKHALHMFQQNRYELNRYLSWMWQFQNGNAKNIIIFCFSVLFWFFLFLVTNDGSVLQATLIILICVVIFFWNFLKEKNIVYIKPLIYTARVKRQTAVLFVVSIVILVSVYFVVPANYWWVYFVCIKVLPWLIIIPVHWITLPIEGLIKKFYLQKAKTILKSYPHLIKVGITGSYGKTSSKNVLHNVLSEKYYTLMTPASFNTPMGITITIRTLLKSIHQVFVVEMGADKVGEINYLTKFVKPQYGVVTSIGPQHLNTFKTLDNIIKEKMKMVENLAEDGVGFLNKDNENIRNYTIKNTCKIVWFGIQEEDVDYRAVDIKYGPYGSKFKVVTRNQEVHTFESRLLGEHNVMNILSAIAVGCELGISWQQLQRAVHNVRFIEHRLELKKINGFTFIDNGFNSNPSGSKMSLDVLSKMPGKRIVITPGMIDLGEQQQQANQEFGKYMLGKADLVLLVGLVQSEDIRRGLEEVGFNMEQVITFKTVVEAFNYIYQNASYEDTILIENDLPDAFNR